MKQLRTGPGLRDSLRRQTFTADTGTAWVDYTYCDAQGKKLPEYGATHIQLRLYYSSGKAEYLGQLEQVCRVPGLVKVTRVTGHPTLRNQVVALFDRES